MKGKTKEFSLNEKQMVLLNEWQEKIKDLFGEYGHYDYTFTPYGMGTGLIVRSHLTKTELDLSMVEDW
jgi:hypothetical protein